MADSDLRFDRPRPNCFMRGCGACSGLIKDLDRFGEIFTMPFDSKETHVRSFMGTICSLFLVIITIAYAFTKMEVLILRKDVDVISTVNDLHFDDTFIFNNENGFNLAVAFTSYDSETEWILDPSYGQLVFNSYSWGPNPDGSYFTERKKLESHVCTREELGLEDPTKSRFLELHETGAPFIDIYQKKLLCLDPSELYVYGDYYSVNARQMNIQLLKCEGGEANGCKDDDEIKEFFRNKFIFLVYNEIRFDSDKYGAQSLVPETRVAWLRINT